MYHLTASNTAPNDVNADISSNFKKKDVLLKVRVGMVLKFSIDLR